jgi:hypothetical protein
MIEGLYIPIWNRTKKTLAIALSGVGRGFGGQTMGAMQIMYNIRLSGIVTMNPPYNQYILRKIILKCSLWYGYYHIHMIYLWDSKFISRKRSQVIWEKCTKTYFKNNIILAMFFPDSLINLMRLFIS